MSVGGVIAGAHTLLVGVEEQDDGGLRLYLNHRSLGLYALVYDEQAKTEIQRQWAGARDHVTLPVPPTGCIYEEAGA